MIEPDKAEQLFAPGFHTRRGTMESLPPQLLNMPAVGSVILHHARGISVGAIQRTSGEPDQVMLMLYEGGPAGGAGGGHFAALDPEKARAHAAWIIRACDLVEAGLDLTGFTPRPPQPEPPADA